MWQAPDGLVWLFYVQRFGATWYESLIKAKISVDGGHTWSDSMNLGFEMGTMVRGRPIVLNNGDYLLPVYHETGSDREVIGRDTTSYFLRHDPKTRTWTPTKRIKSKKGNLQPEAVQITDDYLVAYCRVGGGYEPSTNRYLVRSESHDGGQTWKRSKDSQFPNPNAAVGFIKLQNGHLLLAYNDNMNERIPRRGKQHPHKTQDCAHGSFLPVEKCAIIRGGATGPVTPGAYSPNFRDGARNH